jgi:SulP family sulfate permease
MFKENMTAAQGFANIVSAFLGGIPATGAVARTVTNIRSGGRTPISGIIHSLTLLLIMLFLSPLTTFIPLASLAGIMSVVAWNMSERKQFISLLRSHSIDVTILLVTFTLTVIFDLVIAISVGMVLSSFLFMKRMGDSLRIEISRLNLEALRAGSDGSLETSVMALSESENDQAGMKDFIESGNNLIIYEISGPLFFGAVAEFQDIILKEKKHLRHVIRAS